MKTITEILPGARVTVRGGFGLEPPQKVTVGEIDSKNGRLLFDYHCPKSGSRWAYFDQVVGYVGPKSANNRWDDE